MSDTFAKAPATIAVGISGKCNFKCAMCEFHGAAQNASKKGSRKPGFMDFEKFKELACQYKKLSGDKIRSIHLAADGESLLHPQFPDICRFLEDIEMDFNFFTNGSLLKGELASEIVRMKHLTFVGFSFDGLRKETYEKIRVKGHYEQVKENIEKFIELRNKLNPGIRVNLICVELPENESERNIYTSCWLEKGADSVNFNTFADAGNPVKCEYDIPRVPCRFLWSYMQIRDDGKVIVCCRDAHGELKTGNVFDSSLEAVWNGKEYQDLREAHLKGNWNKYKLCASCRAWMAHAGELEKKKNVFAGIECSFTPTGKSFYIKEETVPGNVHIKNHLSTTLKDAFSGGKNIGLYPGGRHTAWMLELLKDRISPEKVIIFDDSFEEKKEVAGYKCCPPEMFKDSGVEKVFLSSDAPSDALVRKAEERFGPALEKLYPDNWPFTPAKNCIGLPEMDKLRSFAEGALSELNGQEKQNPFCVAIALNYFVWRNFKTDIYAADADVTDILETDTDVLNIASKLKLFISLAGVYGMNAYKIQMENFPPLGFDHTCCELRVGNKAVLFDPFFGAFFSRGKDIFSEILPLDTVISDYSGIKALLKLPCLNGKLTDDENNFVTKLPAKFNFASGIYRPDYDKKNIEFCGWAVMDSYNSFFSGKKER